MSIISKHGSSILSCSRTNLVMFVLLVTAAFVTPVIAGSVSVCSHYLGADATYSQESDGGIRKVVFYGEACAFKFNIQATINTSPWHQYYPGSVGGLTASEMASINETNRAAYSVYMQTSSANTKSDHGIGLKTFDPVDASNIDEVMQYQVDWHYDTFGFVPATCAYQGGNGSYADYIHTYILGGRHSSTGDNYYSNPTTKQLTKYYKITTRMDDSGYAGAGYGLSQF